MCQQSPADIRSALPPARRTEFELDFLSALTVAGATFRLDGVDRVVDEWARRALTGTTDTRT